jgi:hypothetical protein
LALTSHSLTNIQEKISWVFCILKMNVTDAIYTIRYFPLSGQTRVTGKIYAHDLETVLNDSNNLSEGDISHALSAREPASGESSPTRASPLDGPPPH